MKNELETLVEPLVAICTRAGAAILDVYGTDFEVETKSDDTPLTRADLASHREISGSLAEITPEVPVISEESGLPPFAERRTWPTPLARRPTRRNEGIRQQER